MKAASHKNVRMFLRMFLLLGSVSAFVCLAAVYAEHRLGSWTHAPSNPRAGFAYAVMAAVLASSFISAVVSFAITRYSISLGDDFAGLEQEPKAPSDANLREFSMPIPDATTDVEAASPAGNRTRRQYSVPDFRSPMTAAFAKEPRGAVPGERLAEEQEQSRHISHALSQLVQRIALAVDERTPYLRAHSDRVASYAEQIARELGLDDHSVERIRLAALLHDVGTIGVDDSILTKITALTSEEFDAVKSHTVRGAAILRPIEYLRDVIPGVELHHESLDGKGYPYGLRGDEIPLMARVVAVAESFDAMTTARPYHAAMDPDYVLEVMNRLAGKRYDTQTVSALTALVQRGEIVVPHAAAASPARQMSAVS